MNNPWISVSGRMRGMLVAAALVFGVTACTQAPEEQVSRDPVAFDSGDECHV